MAAGSAEVAMPSDTTLTPVVQVQIAAEVTLLLVTALVEVVKGKVQRDFRPPFF